MATTPTVNYFQVQDDQQHDYYFDGCGPITAVVCQGAGPTQPAAIQTWIPGDSPFPSDSCAVIGDYSQAACSAQSADSLSCYYGGGDGNRAVQFVYNAGVLSTPTAAQTSYSPVSVYTITLTGPIAGGGGDAAASGGLSWGSLFLILFLGVACPLYFGGGCASPFRP